MMTGLMRRDPFDVLEPFRRLLEGDLPTGGQPALQVSWPKVEEFQDGNTRVIRAELPDIDPDNDVELTVVDDTLRLRAERQEKSEHKDQANYRSEFRYGSFFRTLPLPAGTKEEDITATYKDGVLEVRAPLQEDEQTSRAKKIEVTRG